MHARRLELSPASAWMTKLGAAISANQIVSLDFHTSTFSTVRQESYRRLYSVKHDGILPG